MVRLVISLHVPPTFALSESRPAPFLLPPGGFPAGHRWDALSGSDHEDLRWFLMIFLDFKMETIWKSHGQIRFCYEQNEKSRIMFDNVF